MVSLEWRVTVPCGLFLTMAQQNGKRRVNNPCWMISSACVEANQQIAEWASQSSSMICRESTEPEGSSRSGDERAESRTQ